MITTTTTTAGPYTTNGSSTAFTFAFPVAENTDVQVWHTDNLGNVSQLVYGTDYTVTTVPGIAGGTVTTTLALDTVGAPGTVFLKRVLPVTQPTSIRNQGAYFPEVIEGEFDRLAMVDQQQGEQIGRSLHMPATDTATNTEIPEQASDGTVLGRVSGKFVWLAAATAQLAADLASMASGKGDALVGVKSDLANSVARTQHQKNADSLNVKDFGAVADGAWNNTTYTASGTDDLAAFTAALAAASSSGISRVMVPGGTYYLSGKLSIPHGVTLEGDGMAHLPLWIAGTKSGTVLLVNGSAASDCVAFTENTGRSGLKNLSIYNTNSNAIRSVLSIVGVLYPSLYNVEVSSLRASVGSGLYLAASGTAPNYETLWLQAHNVVASGTNWNTASECSLKYGLYIYDASSVLAQNSNHFFGGQFGGTFAGLLIDGAAAGSGPISVTFHGTEFDLSWDTASHYTPLYCAAAAGVFGYTKANLYAVPVVQIKRGFNVAFNGCYFEAAGLPATYNDGTNGSNNLIACTWVEGGTESVGTSMIDCAFNGCFLYDLGTKTLVTPNVNGQRHDTRGAVHLGLYQNAAQTVAAYGWTKVTGLVVEFGDDSELEYDSVNNLVKVRSAGTYLISAQVEWTGWAVTGTIYGTTRVIAGGYTKVGQHAAANGAATPFLSSLTAVLNLAAGDTIEWDLFQNQGTNQTTNTNNTRINVVKIA